MMPMTPMVKQLLIINIICYIGSQLAGDVAYQMLALFYPGNEMFRPWQLLTYMFMHSQFNLSHILFNMFSLYLFGSALERFWGANKFLFFYISCGVGAALLHLGVNYWVYQSVYSDLIDAGVKGSEILQILKTGMVSNQILETVSVDDLKSMHAAWATPMVGASGAIYGLMVAFAFMFPNVPMFLLFLPIPIKAKYLIGFTLLGDLVMGMYNQAFLGQGGTGVAHFAHLGGALIGFLMMWYWKKNQFNNNRWN